MKLIFVLVIFALVRVEANWKLVTSEEFNVPKVKHNWSGGYVNCMWKNDAQECVQYTRAEEKMFDGIIAITDSQQDYLNRTFIEENILPFQYNLFKYGKFEIRAAQPKRPLTWTDFSIRDTIGNSFWKDFHLNYYNQQAMLEQKMDYSRNRITHKMPTNVSLNDFHIYSIEFNETDLIWKLDDQETYSKNITGLFPSDPQMQFKIVFGVGGDSLKELQAEQFHDSDCPSLLIDYIRYYEWTDEEVTSDKISENSVTRDDICKQLKTSHFG